MFQVKFADIGEGVHEGVVFKIFVDVDGQVEEGESIMAIETDKVTADIPSPVSGTVKKLQWKPGDKIEVGQTIVLIDDGQEGVRSNMEVDEEEAQADSVHSDTGQSASDESESHSETVEEQGSTSVVGEIEVSSEVIASSSEGQSKPSTMDKIKKVLATPVARKMAKDLGIDIKTIEGTGPAGRILKADIQKAHDIQAKTEEQGESKSHNKGKDIKGHSSIDHGQPSYVPKEPEALIERVPMSMIRKTIAANMTQSKYTIPHTAVMDEVDVTGLVEYRTRTKDMAKDKDIKLTYLAFIVKAVTSALKQHKILNASYHQEEEEIIIKKFYNIGIAVDAPHGLIVPVIHNADQKGILELAHAIDDLSSRGKEKKLHTDELTHGTFTITNYGAFGSSFGVPIIRYPESAVLGIGAITKKPVVVDDEIVIRRIMPLSMSFDHRIIDGADAGRFMRTLKRLLEDPDLLLMS